MKQALIRNYNPFLRLSETMLEALAERRPFIIMQRFNWPGIAPGKGFLVTAYETIDQAKAHADQLHENEGKLLVINQAVELAKVRELLSPVAAYQVFVNGTLDAKNEKRLQREYVRKVYAYIKTQGIRKDGSYEVYITVNAGRVIAVITSGEQRHEAFFYDMIK